MFLILIGSDVVLLNILRSEDVFHGFRGSHVVLPKKNRSDVVLPKIFRSDIGFQVG